MVKVLDTHFGEVQKYSGTDFVELVRESMSGNVGTASPFYSSVSRFTKIPASLFREPLYHEVALEMLNTYTKAYPANDICIQLNQAKDLFCSALYSSVEDYLGDRKLHYPKSLGGEIVCYPKVNYKAGKANYNYLIEALGDNDSGDYLCLTLNTDPFFRTTELYYGIFTLVCSNGLLKGETRSVVKLSNVLATSDLVEKFLDFSNVKIREELKLTLSKMKDFSLLEYSLGSLVSLIESYTELPIVIREKTVRYLSRLEEGKESRYENIYDILPKEVSNLYQLIYIMTYFANFLSISKMTRTQKYAYGFANKVLSGAVAIE